MEEADGLRPQILVGARGPSVAVLRDHAEIVDSRQDLAPVAPLHMNWTPPSAPWSDRRRLHRAPRPIAGQGYSTKLYVQVPTGVTRYPAGAQFIIRAKRTHPENGRPYLKSFHNWDYTVLRARAEPDDQARAGEYRPAEDTLASQRQVGTIRAAVWEFN
jgi:hypothetical protein